MYTDSLIRGDRSDSTGKGQPSKVGETDERWRLGTMPTDSLINGARSDTTGEGRPSQVARELETDAIFFTLSNYRRRFVLRYLLEHDGKRTQRELAESLSAWENGVANVETSSNQRKRAYVSLRQTHLPKLHDLNVIRFDAARGTVERGPELENIVPYLYSTEADAPRNPFTYIAFGLLAVAVLVVGAVALGIL